MWDTYVEDELNSTTATWLFRLTCLAFLATIAFSVVYAAFTLDRHVKAKNSTNAMLATIEACKSFVVENEGKWPRSWDDLEPNLDQWSGTPVESSVLIDFEADPTVLANQTCRLFRGIIPRTDVYRVYDDELTSLIDALKDQVDN